MANTRGQLKQCHLYSYNEFNNQVNALNRLQDLIRNTLPKKDIATTTRGKEPLHR